MPFVALGYLGCECGLWNRQVFRNPRSYNYQTTNPGIQQPQSPQNEEYSLTQVIERPGQRPLHTVAKPVDSPIQHCGQNWVELLPKP